MLFSSKNGPYRVHWWVAAALILLGGIWLVFFDSYSLVRRVGWHQEQAQLRVENAALEQRILELEEQIEAGLTDAMVKQMAREDYGMRLPNEPVYRVEEE